MVASENGVQHGVVEGWIRDIWGIWGGLQDIKSFGKNGRLKKNIFSSRRCRMFACHFRWATYPHTYQERTVVSRSAAASRGLEIHSFSTVVVNAEASGNVSETISENYRTSSRAKASSSNVVVIVVVVVVVVVMQRRCGTCSKSMQREESLIDFLFGLYDYEELPDDGNLVSCVVTEFEASQIPLQLEGT
ncbi:hypothetical protein M0804_000647 [Polistes exclamans]|nr:hypothetical protein M0804_000647 [Polistes exclamans]